jgi:endonuclease-3
MTSARSSRSAELRRRAARVTRILARHYGKAECALRHRNALELLVATILSAQCTDVRVNLVTPGLFRRFPTARALADADRVELERLIRSTGFYRNKARSLRGAARRIVEKHGGEVPGTMEELLELPGVARKTANVVLGTWFGKASGVVVDTHVLRITGLLQLTRQTNPARVERELMELLPEREWIDFSHRLIRHGRRICIARRPKCDVCPLASCCPSAGRVS